MTVRFANRSLQALASIAGGTPAYLYDAALIDASIDALRRALPDELRIHYSLKANPMPAVVDHVAGRTDGLDVASLGELHVALGSGCPAKRISFSGPGKREAELLAAVGAGVIVHAESTTELERLAVAGESSGRAPSISLRVNPDFQVKRSGMVMGGGSRPFGIDAERIVTVARRARELGLSCIGLHCYPGSQLLGARILGALHAATLEQLSRLAVEAGIDTPSLNIGGGFGIPYTTRDEALDIDAVGEALSQALAATRTRCAPGEIVVETGRYITGPAGIYLVRVIDRKVSRDGTWLIVDGGLNHHLAATGNLGQVIPRNYPLSVQALKKTAPDQGSMTDPPRMERVSIAGPLCTPLDTLARDVELPVLDIGDLVAVRQSGAYGFSASPHRFLGHPAPVELLLHPPPERY